MKPNTTAMMKSRSDDGPVRRRVILAAAITLMATLVWLLSGCSGNGPDSSSQKQQIQSTRPAVTNSTPVLSGSSDPAEKPEVKPTRSEPAPAAVPQSKPSGPIKPTQINAQINGNSVSIPADEVDSDINTQFKIEDSTGKMDFMAYKFGDEVFVRADICPPCRSTGYTLDDGILVCNRCATEFEAGTGDGVSGACVDFPKASVAYQVTDGKIIMNLSDLSAAYQDTLKPGWP